MSVRKSFWPISNSHPENVMFTVVVDSDQHFFTAGDSIKGFVFISFTDTKEELLFKKLKLCLRKNISIPNLKLQKKNVNTQLIDEHTLLCSDDSQFSECISDLNNSKPLKIPFEIVLPDSSESSFNAPEVTICYELKADLQELLLCGELCDINTVLPVEVVEIPHDGKSTNKEPSSQLQEAIGDHLLTFYAGLKKNAYSFGENLIIDFYLDVGTCSPVTMQFEIEQLLCLKGEKLRTDRIEFFKGDFHPTKETGILLSKYSFLLDNTLFTSQPSVTRSSLVQVRYHVNVTASFDDTKFEIFIPIHVERSEGIHKRYPRIYSDEGYPLLPLTVTVQELKSDGLQSYIPMKQCYENNRLTVKKGHVGGSRAILTIISESFSAYTKEDTIKGFVYLSISDIPEKVVFDKLIIVLVGVCQYKNTGTIHKNGEMFLFESKVLQGTTTSNTCSNSSTICLNKPSAGIVSEFEFNLNDVKNPLPPTFNSDDLFISYELKADMFNLCIGDKKASLYARLPIVMKDDKLIERLTIPKCVGKICKKDFTISLNMDKPVYKHRDDIHLKINFENKSRKQMTVRICLVQFTECMETHTILREQIVSVPIILIVIPKGRLVSDEKISLNDDKFHYQPTLLLSDKLSVTYSVIVDVPDGEHSTKIKNKIAIPVAITRKQGYKVKELTCEGYPLLPLTLEYYAKGAGGFVPTYLDSYKEHSLMKVLSSTSCLDRWKGWKLKS